MANDHAQSVGPSELDYDEHEKTYKLFLRLVTFSIVGAAGILILLAFIAG